MSGSHTPGPWKFGHLGTEAFWVGPEYDEIPVAQVTHDTADARDESRANAKLISAAPDLLKALISLRGEISDGVDYWWGALREAVDAADEAIAKATTQSEVG